MANGLIPVIPSHVTPVKIPEGVQLYRVHAEKYGAVQFNPGSEGNARFSPIKNTGGEVIPTIYAGGTQDCALMETLFHDVAFAPGYKTHSLSKLDGLVISEVVVRKELQLADLRSKPLRKLGVTRVFLIESEASEYSRSREYAEALYEACPEIQGLLWVSRQDDSALAMVLFEDRIPVNALQQRGGSRSLRNDPATLEMVVNLAGMIGVDLT